jgi:hypothetical protein
LENLFRQKIVLSFYFAKGVQIGLFLSFTIKSTTSFTSLVFLNSPFNFFKFSFRWLVLNISLYALVKVKISLLGNFVFDGINLIGLRRKNIPNKDILTLTSAYKEIFKTNHLNENLKKLNGEFKNTKLVNEVVDFIVKDKKRPICTPLAK